VSPSLPKWELNALVFINLYIFAVLSLKADCETVDYMFHSTYGRHLVKANLKFSEIVAAIGLMLCF